MAQTRAAIRYAKAIFDLAKDQKSAEIVNTDMKAIANAVSTSKDLSDMLQSPIVRTATKKSALLAKVTTAVALTDDLKTKVLAKVKELTGKDAEIESIIDESILGGFILRVGDIQYNASIANKLSKLKREFTLN